MSKNKAAEVTTKIVDLLEPLDSAERQRAVNAALMLLGETQTPSAARETETFKKQTGVVSLEGQQPRVRSWLTKNGVTAD